MITTDRLLLRPYELGDYAAYFAMNTDTAVERFHPAPPMSPEDAWIRMLRHAGHWALLGYGTFAVIEAVSGRYLGETGVGDFHRGIGEDFDGFDEASWSFAPAAQGQGYALEAASAAHRWYFAHKGPARTVCMTDPGHKRSIRLAEKLGYRFLRTGEYKSNPVVIYERPAS